MMMTSTPGIPKPAVWRPAYRIDALVLGMFAGAALDCVTTCIFISRRIGFETNPVARPLFGHSLWWVPVYLLCRPALVPLMPGKSRRAFALFFLLLGFACGVNNLGGILTRHYFLLDMFGIEAVTGACFLAAAVLFIFDLVRCGNQLRARRRQIETAAGWLIFFGIIEGAFFLAGRSLRSH